MVDLMSVFQAADLGELTRFPQRKDQLAVLQRQAPKEAEVFFEKLMHTSIGVIGKVKKENAEADIQEILEDYISVELQQDPFYNLWIKDMASVCRSFCEILCSDAVSFCLASKRGCRRYHIDNVPMRLLVTYAGKGTEYIPDEAADRKAFQNGMPNERIIKDPSAIKFMNTWDVAVFRGGSRGLLHRTPDAALNQPSILMRLDHPSFWDNI